MTETDTTERRALPPAPQEPSGLLENMFAPELYATFASSFSVTAGSVTIKLVSSRWDNSVEPAVQSSSVALRCRCKARKPSSPGCRISWRNMVWNIRPRPGRGPAQVTPSSPAPIR